MGFSRHIVSERGSSTLKISPGQPPIPVGNIDQAEASQLKGTTIYLGGPFGSTVLGTAQNAEIIRSITAGFSQEEATTKSSPESWSVLEVLCHLRDLECEDFRPRLKDLLNGNLEQWAVIDPKGWVEGRSYNSCNFDGMRNAFLAERSKLDWLQTLSSPNWEIEYSDDGGSMQAGHLFVSWAAHDNLHIRQLVELRRARIVSLATPYEVMYAGKW